MHKPGHPGAVLREWLPEGMAIEQAAEQLYISRMTLSKVLNAKSGLTASMALRLASWFGNLSRLMAWDAATVGFSAG